MNHHSQQQLKIPLSHGFLKPTIRTTPNMTMMTLWIWIFMSFQILHWSFQGRYLTLILYRVDIWPFDNDDPLNYYMVMIFDLENVRDIVLILVPLQRVSQLTSWTIMTNRVNNGGAFDNFHWSRDMSDSECHFQGRKWGVCSYNKENGGLLVTIKKNTLTFSRHTFSNSSRSLSISSLVFLPYSKNFQLRVFQFCRGKSNTIIYIGRKTLMWIEAILNIFIYFW